MKAAIFYFTMSGNTELAAKEVAEATGAHSSDSMQNLPTP